jgi:hypothetical protein
MRCDATRGYLKNWTADFFGADLGAKVFEKYSDSTVQLPVPECPDGESRPSGDKSLSYFAGMRAVGDASITCRARDIAVGGWLCSFVFAEC